MSSIADRYQLRELAATKGSGADESEDSLIVPEDAAMTVIFPDLRRTFPFTTIWSQENFFGEIIGLLPNKEQAGM